MSCAFGYESFEHFSEIERHLFERKLNRFETLVVKTFDQIDDMLEVTPMNDDEDDLRVEPTRCASSISDFRLVNLSRSSLNWRN
jgi:hypothetical protein